MNVFPGSSSKEDGLLLLKAGQAEEAIQALEQALAVDSDDYETHMYLGAAYHQNADRLHSIHHFEESLRLQETAKGYYNLGLVYEAVHRYDEAVRQYRMALELDADYAKAQDALNKLHSLFESQHPAAESGAEAAAAPPAA